MCYFVCSLQSSLGLGHQLIKCNVWLLFPFGASTEVTGPEARSGFHMTSLPVAPKVLYVVELVYLRSVCVSPPEPGWQLRGRLLPSLCLLQAAQISKLGKTRSFMGAMLCSDSQLKAPTNQRRYEELQRPKRPPGSGPSLSGGTCEPHVQSIPAIRWFQF